MKKLLSLALALCLLLPCVASAEDALENASLDELLAAKQLISNRITQLIVRQEGTAEGFTLSGEGMDITDGYTIPAGLWRRTITARQAEFEDKVTLSIGGKNTTIKIDDGIVSLPITLSSPRSVDYAVVETDSAWSISYTPISGDGSIDVSGDGGFVSDCFPCTKPTMVNIGIKNDTDTSTYLSVRLYTISASGYLSSEYDSELMVSDVVDSGASTTYKAIIKPEDRIAAYLWVIVCDAGVEWSIKAKEH